MLVISAICIESISYVYDGGFLQLDFSIVAVSLASTVDYWKDGAAIKHAA
jgi:hypothetical protein